LILQLWCQSSHCFAHFARHHNCKIDVIMGWWWWWW